MIHKRILVPQRLRCPPASGWSWVDRGFLRDHAERLSREALLLYLYLAAVSDRHGLSFRNDPTIALALRLRPDVVARAREELVEHDLVACESPLTQVLSLPKHPPRRQAAPGQGLMQLGDLFRQIAGQSLEPSDSPSARRSP
jgi:hypothetical protein